MSDAATAAVVIVGAGLLAGATALYVETHRTEIRDRWERLSAWLAGRLGP